VELSDELVNVYVVPVLTKMLFFDSTRADDSPRDASAPPILPCPTVSDEEIEPNVEVAMFHVFVTVLTV
jgi:hypothetical protein